MSVAERYDVRAGKHGDFAVESYDFEVGGPGKKGGRLRDSPRGFRMLDDVEVGGGNRIPLYLFGLLY